MSGQIVLKESTNSADYTKGLRFPNDPYGGSNDTSGMRLYNTTSENMCLELYTGNDGALDTINFATGVSGTPNNDSVTINGNKIWNAGNLTPQIQLNGTGFVKASGTTISYDNSTYLTTSAASSTYLPLAGGTITGSLGVNSTATFGSSITASGNLNLQAGATRNINFYDTTNTNINAQIQYEELSVNSGQLNFGTNSSGTFNTKLQITNAGVSTFYGNSMSIRQQALTANQSITWGIYNSVGGARSYVGFPGNSSSQFSIVNYEAGVIDFATNSLTRMTITSAGNVGIGTSSPNNTYSGLTIYGSDPSLSMTTSNSGGWVWTQYVNSSGTNNFSMGVNQAVPYWGVKVGAGMDSPTLVVSSGGNVLIGTTTDNGYKLNVNGQPGANGYTLWTNYSDLRLKENVTNLDANNILERINNLRPVTYNYNELSGFDEETRNRRISGFIAQELKEVFPDMVGTIKIKNIEYYDTNLSNLTLYLVKAIQELNEKLTRNNIN